LVWSIAKLSSVVSFHEGTSACPMSVCPLIYTSNLVQDPECVDKDLLRRWYVSHCDPYDASLALPEVPADLVAELSRRYVNRLSEWVVVP
jgi:hypothetical protein